MSFVFCLRSLLPNSLRWSSFRAARTGHFGVVARLYGNLPLKLAAAWQAGRERNGEQIDFAQACQTSLANLERCRYSSSSKLLKIFDHVVTAEQLRQAEEVLTSFRCGLGQPHPGLPRVVLRACLRLGLPKRAVQYIKNKRMYGIFPSRHVYNVLLDALVGCNEVETAVAVYREMLRDEVNPDGVTHCLMARAHCMLGGEAEVCSAVEHCRACPTKMGSRAYCLVVKSLLKQGRAEEALKLLEQERDRISAQTLLNLSVHTLVACGELSQVITLLESQCQAGGLGLPREAVIELQDACASQPSLLRQLEALTLRLQSST